MKVSDLIQSRQVNVIEKFANAAKSEKSGGKNTVNFGDTMKEFLNAVNDGKIESGQKVADIIQGKSENLAEAMSSLEESSISFQLMLEIRNKLIQSYQEINRMPV